ATVQINDRWRSELNVGYLHLRSTGDLLGLLPRTNLSVPRMRWNMRHVINVNRKLRIVPTFSWSDSVVNASLVSPGSPVRLDPYLRVDLAVHYKPGGAWPDLSLVATNLADRSHLEFVEDAVRPATPITRAFYLRASREF
ncbi:MAG: TonB-dependent receptor, partial [Deltaproteobacteria bacterium]|nr:TonB-dependent receptor [Deltaproteobacteria bacterium]